MQQPNAATDVREVDVLVVGSGAGALTAAVTAAKKNLRVLVVEKAALFGGTSATSGAIAWIPGNPHMPATGERDSPERAMRYLRSVIGNQLRPDVLEAYLANGPKAIAFLERETEVRYEPTFYPDYKSDADGAMEVGRSIQPQAYDGRRLGSWFRLLAPPLAEFCVLNSMMVEDADLPHFLKFGKSLKSTLRVSRLFLAFVVQRALYGRGTRLTMGNALIAGLLRAARDSGVELWRNAAAVELLRDGDRVTGAAVNKDGHRIEIAARWGVVLGTGGFPHDAEMMRRYIPHADKHLTLAAKTDTGDGLRMAMAAGARMGEGTFLNFLGNQISVLRDSQGRVVTQLCFMHRDRTKPGFVMVNRRGKRFVNDAGPYNDVAHAMIASEDSVPSFYVSDHAALRKYGFGLLRPGPAWLRRIDPFLRTGYLVRANTIRELAARVGIDPDGLEETVARNNAYARTGKDLEFGKGDTLYDRVQGDPAVRPNPNLGPIEQPPFYALTVWPGNLSTTCGLVTDAQARVLGPGDAPIEGLYACGTDLHSIFSGHYPGAGCSIGPSLTFGFVAGSTIAERASQARGTKEAL